MWTKQSTLDWLAHATSCANPCAFCDCGVARVRPAVGAAWVAVLVAVMRPSGDPACPQGATCTDGSLGHALHFTHPTPCRAIWGLGATSGQSSTRRPLRVSLPVANTTPWVAITPVLAHIPDFSRCRCGCLLAEGRMTRPIWNASATGPATGPAATGRACRHLARGKPDHCRRYYHLPREPCPLGRDCPHTFDRAHCAAYAHPEMPDFKIPCREGRFCPLRTQADHARKYSHPAQADLAVPVLGLNDRMGFFGNKAALWEAIAKWAQPAGGDLRVDPSIEEWVRRLHLVHRCRAAVLGLILDHGGLLSRRHQEAILACEGDAQLAREVLAARTTWGALYEYLRAFIKTILPQPPADAPGAARAMAVKKASTPPPPAPVPIPASDDPKRMARCLQLRASLCQSDPRVAERLDAIEARVRVITRAVGSTKGSTGIKFAADQLLGTDKQVPHCLPWWENPTANHSGGLDGGGVVDGRSPKIMFHPDFSMTPNAATMIHNGKTFAHRPWAPADCPDRVQLFHRSKLSGAVQGWATVMAAELQAMAAVAKKKPFAAATLSDVRDYYRTANSHFVVECHLPSFVPLTYVERIVLPRDSFESLAPCHREALSRELPRGLAVAGGIATPTEHLPRLVCLAPDPFSKASQEGWFEAPVPILQDPRKCGFTVTLTHKQGTPVPLPVHSRRPGEVRCRFSALGSGILLTLARPGVAPTDLTPEEARAFYTVGLGLPRDAVPWRAGDQAQEALKKSAGTVPWSFVRPGTSGDKPLAPGGLLVRADLMAGIDVGSLYEVDLSFSHPAGRLVVRVAQGAAHGSALTPGTRGRGGEMVLDGLAGASLGTVWLSQWGGVVQPARTTEESADSIRLGYPPSGLPSTWVPPPRLRPPRLGLCRQAETIIFDRKR
ncbi:hypothetical protein PAPYR_7255 [Paratrimastix pyriformis]|uniref:C3H1-type domain-containing protein n=1 Tax=Paratrimastix pyriformis TaxID=342808 RepID=A0ABQ8UDH1_9EUKA|nr:hypothetical protein PAPYR_7255 [Paratrimastix pyriformis]